MASREASGYRWGPRRPPALALNGMVASSQGTATRAGLRMLDLGGNAVDAAIAAAAVLAVAEPMSTGIGGDAFAIVAQGSELTGLDAAGPAPVAAPEDSPIASSGPTSVTVPGAVGGWSMLHERFGRLGFDTCLTPAIDVAEHGFPLGAHAARYWSEAVHVPAGWPTAPDVGTALSLPDLARSLRVIADAGPSAFYEGPIAAAIAHASWLDESDLADYAPSWVTPLSVDYDGVRVWELPAPTQGVAALEALSLFDRLGTGLPNQVTAVALALEDAFAYVRDGADVGWLLSDDHLRSRVNATPRLGRGIGGGTVYLCSVDQDGMAVSFIQSIYTPFGSGVLVPGTGIVLNNRAACFAVNGHVEPGRRPYHTIIPGLLTSPDGGLIGPFGVMGGFIQAQAHLQFVIALLESDFDPQAALDRGRFRVDGDRVHLEPPLWQYGGELEATGFHAQQSKDLSSFGGGQAICVRDGTLFGGSDSRKDGYAAGL